jgi:hypothetical protein
VIGKAQKWHGARSELNSVFYLEKVPANNNNNNNNNNNIIIISIYNCKKSKY